MSRLLLVIREFELVVSRFFVPDITRIAAFEHLKLSDEDEVAAVWNVENLAC